MYIEYSINGESKATTVSKALIERSARYTMTPYPFDEYVFEFDSDHLEAIKRKVLE